MGLLGGCNLIIELEWHNHGTVVLEIGAREKKIILILNQKYPLISNNS